MPKLDLNSVSKFGANNFRNLPGRNFGKPLNPTDAMTFAVPSYTTTERDALPNVTNGTIIYNSTTNVFNFYENGSWVTK